MAFPSHLVDSFLFADLRAPRTSSRTTRAPRPPTWPAFGLRTEPSLAPCMGCRVSLKSHFFNIFLVTLLVGFAGYFVNEPAALCGFPDHGDQKSRTLLASEGPSRPYEGAHYSEDFPQESHLGTESTGGEGHPGPAGPSLCLLAPAAGSRQNATDESAVVVLQVQYLEGSQGYVLPHLRSPQGIAARRAHVLGVLAAGALEGQQRHKAILETATISSTTASVTTQAAQRKGQRQGQGRHQEQASYVSAGGTLADLASQGPSATGSHTSTGDSVGGRSSCLGGSDEAGLAGGGLEVVAERLASRYRPALGHPGPGGRQCRKQGPAQSHQRSDRCQEGASSCTTSPQDVLGVVVPVHFTAYYPLWRSNC